MGHGAPPSRVRATDPVQGTTGGLWGRFQVFLSRKSDFKGGREVDHHRGLAAAISLCWAAVGLAAGLIAMRVDVHPVQGAGDETTVEIEVQVAPEDRARVGSSAWVQVELRRGDRVLDRTSRAAEVGPDGVIRLESTWPVGSAQLRVDLEGQGGDGGFWVGAVKVPRVDGAASAPEASPPESPPLHPPPPVAPDLPPSSTVRTEPAVAPSPPALPSPGRAGAWPGLADGESEVTAMVLRRNRPVTGLEAADFRVRVDGGPAEPTRVGGRQEVGLWLGLAVDVSSSMAERLPEVRELLARLSLSADAGLSLVTCDDAPQVAMDWTSSPAGMAAALAEAGGATRGDLAGLVVAGLGQLSGRSGRRLLVVVTDGGATSNRERWGSAESAARDAGVPVLLIGYRGGDLEGRERRSLEKIVDLTGGKSYVVRPRDTGLLKLVGDHFSELAQASYALRFAVPGGGRHTIDIETVEPDLEVLGPGSVR